MTAPEIINQVKKLNLPEGEYIVFGSCPMALAGIREARDVDLLVSESVFAKLRSSGWEEYVKSPNDKPLVRGDIEAHANWDFSSYKPTLQQLLPSATFKEEVPFASLEAVKKWKSASGRPKDLKDVALIDTYLKSALKTV